MSGEIDDTTADSAPRWRAPQDPDEPALPRGATIGRHVILGRLGAGGMGVVHAAYDPELDRKVAIKLLRAPDSPAVAHSDGRTRLLREAQALARLNHPNVVAVHDVGAIDDQVWLAMEYVDGHTLGAWLALTPRRWPEILRVGIDVARGLVAAHAADLIHRDLKPDNIMIGRDGRVRVMDFGLARATEPPAHNLNPPAHNLDPPDPDRTRAPAPSDPDRTRAPDPPDPDRTRAPAPSDPDRTRAPDPPDPDRTRAATLPLRHLGTPSGLGHGPALALRLTRVGALLGTPAYMAPEQLAGRPADARADQFALCLTLWEALYGQRPFAGDDLDELAANIHAGKLRAGPRRGVPGWLRRILVRGLQPDPARRFASMTALLAPLRRGLHRRWTRPALALALLALLALLAGLAWTRHAEHRARAACLDAGNTIHAVWNQARSDALRIAMGGPTGALAHARMLPWLDRWTGEWSQLRARVCVEAQLEHTRSPDLYARATACLDERRDALDALLTSLAGDATASHRAVPGVVGLPRLAPCTDAAALARRPPLPADPTLRRELSAVRRSLLQLHELRDAGRYAEALTAAEALRVAAERLGHAPLAIEARAQIGDLAERFGDLPRAEAALARAYVEAGSVGADELAAELALTLIYVAHEARKDLPAALAWARSAELFIARTGQQDGLLGAALRVKLAPLQPDERALAGYAGALKIQAAILGPDHPGLGPVLNNLANRQRRRADYPEAAAHYERALAVYEPVYGPDHPSVALTLNNLAVLREDQGDPAAALALHTRALAIRERSLGPDHLDVASSLTNLSTLYAARGEHEQALAAATRAVAIRERVLGKQHPDVADALTNLANIHHHRGDNPAALALYRHALQIRERTRGPDDVTLAPVLNNLAAVAEASGDLPAARALNERALRLRERALGPAHPEVARSLNNLAGVLLRQRDLSGAEPLLARALQIRERALGPGHPGVAHVLVNLAELARLRGDLDAAWRLHTRALQIREAALPPEHPDIATSLTELGHLALARTRPAEAVPLLERALALRARQETDAQLAALRLDLARALWSAPPAQARDRPRARALATTAATTDPDATTWLTRHPA